MNTLAVTFSTTSLVGNSLGENRPKVAKTYAKTALLFGCSQICLIVFAFWVIRYTVIGAFTSDPTVSKLIMDSFIIYSFAIAFDWSQGLGGGILRAIGYQHFASITLFISMWCVLVPLAYYFGFVLDLGFEGVWYAAPIGPLCWNIGYFFIIFWVSWEKLALRASKKHEQEIEISDNWQKILD